MQVEEALHRISYIVTVTQVEAMSFGMHGHAVLKCTRKDLFLSKHNLRLNNNSLEQYQQTQMWQFHFCPLLLLWWAFYN